MRRTILAGAALAAALVAPARTQLDERPAAAGEWGFRPAAGQVLRRTPPPFAWRPQRDVATYEVQASRDAGFASVDYSASGIRRNVHCPPRVFESGGWSWRFRVIRPSGETSPWSSARAFDIAAGARPFPLPVRDELLARIPHEHPRLFVRPEQRAVLRSHDRQGWKAIRKQCDRLVEAPPPTAEPARYPAGTKRGSDAWRALWWGNRRYTIRTLESAATLAFAWWLERDNEYGESAKRILLDAAKWDPHGATGYRYNDEAAMPYAYHFSRAYTFLHDLLSQNERALCRQVMQARGREMYERLTRSHLWKPYGSHANRAWHFLGEAGVAFHGEIEEAADWVMFAVDVFANAYPVWSDDDGGWHEGTRYWGSYLSRFTWWADVQRVALGLDAYALPFFARAGDYAMYLAPPGTLGGGFGDLNAKTRSANHRAIMTVLAQQARDPHWQWWVDRHGGPAHAPGYVGFLRGLTEPVAARPPADLPTSKCFRGTGIAVLNRTLQQADDNVEVIFKSSPFGSQSHGYEAQNSFLLYAFGERLLIRSGYRDQYGSRHHREWMWDTKSVNSVTVDGEGQVRHSAKARGEIVAFHTEPGLHYVEGEAGPAYAGRLEGFRRGILFVAPDLIVVHDRLAAKAPTEFAWHLHAPSPFADAGAGRYVLEQGKAACTIEYLAPDELTFAQTDRFDPPPRPRIQLVEHHLTATCSPRTRCERVLVVRPHRVDDPSPAWLTRVDGGGFETDAGDRRLRVELAPSGLRVSGTDGAVAFDAARVEGR